MIFSSFKIALALGAMTLAGAGYMYVKGLQSDLETARANVAKMEVAVQTSEASLKLLQGEAEKLQQLNMQLSTDLQKAEQYGDELRNTLQKHNLTHLANKKPGLIQKRMQNATNQLWDDLESATAPDGLQHSVPRTESSNSN